VVSGVHGGHDNRDVNCFVNSEDNWGFLDAPYGGSLIPPMGVGIFAEIGGCQVLR
jgi:hypothetical protein